jgi:hypothetical protein
MAHWSIITSVNSATAAILVLTLIGAALVYAALYALFGKPSTSRAKKRRQEVINGFQLAGGILLGLVLMSSLIALTAIAFKATSQGLRIFAGVTAASELIVIGLMAQWWAKYFGGFIAWGILNSLIMASSGHLLNNPSIPAKRSLALIMAGLCLVSVLVTLRFTKVYKLHWTEKFALLWWIEGFAVAATIERFSIPALASGTFALVLAWWLHRSQVRHRSHHSIHRHEPIGTLTPD